VIEVSILIPWRTDNGPRQRVFGWALRRWEELLPKAQICIAGDEGEPFNRGAARNRAFEQSRGQVLVIADADTVIPTQEVLDQALVLAGADRWVLPYALYYNLTEADTERVLGLPPSASLSEPTEWEFRLSTAVSGVIVLPRRAFEAVHGYDESFEGWGYEDRCFALALNTLWRPCVQLPGHVQHLWHPVGPGEAFGNPAIHRNHERWLRYRRACGNPGRMTEVVVGPT
jgi:hypothetical protein